MELMSIGFLEGAVFTLLIISIGAISDDRSTERQCTDDSDTRIYVPCRDRGRSGSDGCDISPETATYALAEIKRSMQKTLSHTEQAAIDYAINHITEAQNDQTR